MDQLVDIRTLLAASRNARVEVGRDGVVHVLAGHVTLHLDRAMCEELTTTMARAMVSLSQIQQVRRPPALSLVRTDAPAPATAREAPPTKPPAAETSADRERD